MNLSRVTIDDGFIAEWHPRYDLSEDDQPEYDRLVSTVRKESEESHRVSKQTFTDILNWKATRVKGKIDWAKIDDYLNAIRSCLADEKQDRLTVLVELRGIGVPVASTILHFVRPSGFPIMDVRTVEVLHKCGYISHMSRDVKRYAPFRDAILSIQRKSPKWTLREIDRALFSFHK